MPYKDKNAGLDCHRLMKRRWRYEAIKAYGGRCACCGEWRIELLGFDHVGGGGTVHRTEIGHDAITSYLRRNKYPKGFRVLCHSCNLSMGFYGYCPHELEREAELSVWGTIDPQSLEMAKWT